MLGRWQQGMRHGGINAGKTHQPDESSATKAVMRKKPLTTAEALNGASNLPRIRRPRDADTPVPVGAT